MGVGRPDQGYSWVIMLCCAYMHFAVFGIFRSAGVIYFALLSEYNVSREEASWPFSLCPAVFQLVGPVVSVITYYLSQRLTCFLGCTVATIGLVACYFAKSVLWITFFYGVIHGAGFGVLAVLIPVFLNQYFLKHRSTALGIAFSGGSIGSFVFPIILEWLLENYGLRGTFLLLGGVVMNTVVASALLRPAPWLKKSHKKHNILNASDTKDSAVFISGDTHDKIKSSNKSAPVKHCDSVFYDIKKLDDDSKISTDPDTSAIDISSTIAKSDYEDCDVALLSNNDSIMLGSMNKVVVTENSCNSNKSSKIGVLSEYEIQQQKEPLMNESSVCSVPVIPSKNQHKFQKATRSILSLLKNPMFHLIYISMFIYFLGLQVFLTVIVDYSIDKGLTKEDGAYIMSVFSIFDLVGRSGLGWVTDRNIVKRNHMLIIDLGCIGIILPLYSFINDLTGLFVVTGLHGIITGCCISLFFVLMPEYVGMEKLTLAMGLSGFFNGLLTLLRPTVVGLFRDTIGSYDWMFLSLGFVTVANALIWIGQVWSERNKKTSDQVFVVT